MRLRVSRYSDALYSLMRFVVGLLFTCHGAQKLFGVFGGHAVTGKPLLLAAGLIEFAGGLLIALGFFARIAAFIASGEMAVAYVTAYAPHGLWPIENKGEIAVLNCFVFLYLASAGAGRYSLDRAVRGAKATAAAESLAAPRRCASASPSSRRLVSGPAALATRPPKADPRQ